jgi:hypothetical protein
MLDLPNLDLDWSVTSNFERFSRSGARLLRSLYGRSTRGPVVDIPRCDLVERRESAATLIVAIIFDGSGDQ